MPARKRSPTAMCTGPVVITTEIVPPVNVGRGYGLVGEGPRPGTRRNSRINQ